MTLDGRGGGLCVYISEGGVCDKGGVTGYNVGRGELENWSDMGQ